MKIKFYSLIFLSVLFFSCKSSYKAVGEPEPVMTYYHSKTAVDWQGTYLGVIPCADCEGIQKTISLDSNFNYRVRIKYLGKEDAPQEYTGTFSWNRAGNIITMEDVDGELISYFVAENTLAQLDKYGNRISGELAPNYILSKERFTMLRRYWKLTELNGRSVVTNAGFGKEPHIIFKEGDNRFSGYAGCNNFSGTFRVNGINDISLSQVITTTMACPTTELEARFLNALQAAENYSIVDGDKLVLSRAGIISLATFATVYVKEEISMSKNK